MTTSVINYLALIISVAGLVISILALRKAKAPTIVVQEKVVVKEVLPSSVPTPEKKPAPILESPVVITVEEKTNEIVVPDVVEPIVSIFENTPKKKVLATAGPTNTWFLEVTGKEGTPYNIHIEWSDGSSDIESGVTPEEETFIHQKGVVPVKVVGIPPHGDAEVQYSWELNGFHWS